MPVIGPFVPVVSSLVTPAEAALRKASDHVLDIVVTSVAPNLDGSVRIVGNAQNSGHQHLGTVIFNLPVAEAVNYVVGRAYILGVTQRGKI